MDVSVIIVNYRSSRLVSDCIRSLREKTAGVTYEVIVVDNASGDDSLDFLGKEFGDTIKLIRSDINLGFGKANNLGAGQASGKYLFLLNPDTLLMNNAVKVLYDYLESHPEVGVAGGNLYSPEGTEAPSHCLEFDSVERERKNAGWRCLIGGKVSAKLRGCFAGKEVPRFSREFNHGDEPQKVAYIFGADMMLPRQLFEAVGGFDPEFFMYAEEEELSWRITEKGYRIMNVPQAQIIHLEGATLKNRDAFSEQQFRMRMNGSLIYYKKCYGLEGAKAFYRYRSLRYQRLMRIAQVQGKLTNHFIPAVQKRCLDEVYEEFVSKQ